MRKLAGELGVEAMSLYNHVANKADLVDALVDVVVDEIDLTEAEPWDASVREYAIAAHRTFLRHPWACSLVVGPGAGGGMRTSRLRYMEWLLGRLRNGGLSPALTYSAYHALDGYVLGFTLWQLGHGAAARDVVGDEEFDSFAARIVPQLRADGYAHLAEHVEQHLAAESGDGEREFEFGLDLILDGLRSRAAAPPPRRARRGR